MHRSNPWAVARTHIDRLRAYREEPQPVRWLDMPPPRPVIVGINVPGENETWSQLNQWRRSHGLRPVEEGWNEE